VIVFAAAGAPVHEAVREAGLVGEPVGPQVHPRRRWAVGAVRPAEEKALPTGLVRIVGDDRGSGGLEQGPGLSAGQRGGGEQQLAETVGVARFGGDTVHRRPIG